MGKDDDGNGSVNVRVSAEQLARIDLLVAKLRAERPGPVRPKRSDAVRYAVEQVAPPLESPPRKVAGGRG